MPSTLAGVLGNYTPVRTIPEDMALWRNAEVKITELSGSSTVRDLAYQNGTATLIYEDWDSEDVFGISVRTDTIYSEADSAEFSVHCRVLELAQWLTVEPESDVFVMPSDFGRTMQVVRQQCHLAVGRKASEYKHILQIRGHQIILACPLRSLSDVTVRRLG